MERAQANHFFPLFFQIQMLRNDIDDVIRLLNPADQVIVPLAGQNISVSIAPLHGTP